MTDSSIKSVPSQSVTGGTLSEPAASEPKQKPVRREAGGSPSGVHSRGLISKLKSAFRRPAAAIVNDLSPAGNGPVNDANQLVASLIAKKTTGAELLRVLSQMAGNAGAGDPRRSFYEQKFSMQLRKAISGLTPAQRSSVAARLASPAVAALRHTLREGVGPLTLNNRAAAVYTTAQIGQQLATLQKILGVEAAAPGKKDFKQARRDVDAFVRQFDSGWVKQTGTFDKHQIASMQLGYIPFDNDELARNPADLFHSNVSKDFAKQSPHNCYLLQHEDGRCEWLLPPHLDGELDNDDKAKLAAQRLLQFCNNDEQASLAISQAATQNTAEIADLDLALVAGELPLIAGPAGEDSTATIAGGKAPMMGHKALTGFVIKKTADGNYQVLARSSAQLTAQNSKSGPIALNPNQSHWDTEVEVEIGSNRRPQFKQARYEFVAAAHLGKVDSSQAASQPRLNARAAAAELLAQQNRISVYGDFQSLPVNGERVRENSGASIDDMAAELVEAGILAESQASGILDRIQFAKDAEEELARIGSDSEAQIEQLIERTGDLASDLRLLQQDLLLKAQAWSMNLDSEQTEQLNTFLVRVANDLGKRAQQIEDVAAGRSAALDDGRGDINEVVSGSLLARAENGWRQALAIEKAMSGIADEIYSQSQSPQVMTDSEGEAVIKILKQVKERVQAREAGSHAVVEGRAGADQQPAAGARGKNLDRAARQVSRALAAGEPLPQVHEQLSEAQLFRLQINELVRQHPALEPYFADFDSMYAQAVGDLIAQGRWQKIENSFHDIDGQGRLQKLTSTITPAPQFNEPHFHYSYGGRGVSSGNRTQGRHVSNLAHSELTNEAGQQVFSGLRHGILDAYRINADQLGEKMPDARLRELITDTLLDDPKWQEFVFSRSDRPSPTRFRLHRFAFDLIRSGDAEAIRLAAERARPAANLNAARELATAAIIANPVLHAQAIATGQVTVDLDSISLVTPDRLRGRGGKEGERTYLANQKAALDSLAAQPFTVKIGTEYGHERSVQVTVRPRSFNFGVNDYAVGTSPSRILLKGFMGWDEADRTNRESLAALIGDPEQLDEVGGEAGQLLAWLDGDLQAQVSDTTKATVSSNTASSERRRTAFDEHAQRAEAIRSVSRQIKEIFTSRSHRRSGNEPYKLASRVALLSNLLGRSTCYNCKSGKDRTGQMDAAVKQLATDAAAGNLPVPNALPDQRRTTNFVLKTGNLEMQQHNTGLQGYKLSGPRALFAQLISPLAKKMFSGDSKLVKS